MLFYQGSRQPQTVFPGKGILVGGLGGFLFLWASYASAGSDFDHFPWKELLEAHVSEAGVDYPGFSRDRKMLDHYLERLSAVRRPTLEAWPPKEQIAFYANAYNAVVVERVLDHYPPEGKALFKSERGVAHIPGMWDEIKDRVAGEDLTLRDIQEEILIKRYGEPLVLFTLSPASRGGPPLPSQPLEESRLTRQLNRFSQEFLLDAQTGVVVDRVGAHVLLPKLFDRFGKDFASRYGGGLLTERFGDKLGASLNFVSRYLPPREKEFIEHGEYTVDFRPHDGALNQRNSVR